MRVSDIPNDAVLVTDSTEIADILDYCGYPDDDQPQYLWVIINDGDYWHIWAADSAALAAVAWTIQ